MTTGITTQFGGNRIPPAIDTAIKSIGIGVGGGVNDHPALLAGLDIGGSKVLAVAVTVEGPGVTVLHRVLLPTAPGPEGVLDTAVRAVEALAAGLSTRRGAAPPAPAELFTAVGIGIPGLVDPERGTVRHAVNLGLGGQELALADRLRQRLGIPFGVENDVNAAAVGAAAQLPGAVDLAYLGIGTGLAAGIVLGGALRRGPHAATGEIGHVPLDPGGPPCICGQRGCLEVLASGSAIAGRWPAERSEPGRGRAQALFAAAAAGDPRAVSVRDEVAGYLAAAVRLVALIVDVDVVVLGGGVSEVGPPLRQAVSSALERQAETSPFLRGLGLAERVRVLPRAEPVAAVGAALLARRTHLSPAAVGEPDNT